MSSAELLCLVVAFCLAILTGNLANYIRAATERQRAQAKLATAEARAALSNAGLDGES